MTFAQPFKDYEILDRIGSGAMGTVFRARHKSLNRIVALKVLRPSLARDQRYVNRLSREARIVAAFNHPNIVAGYDLGQEGGYHFFVMELVEGKSLRELLSEWGSFPEAQVLDTAIKITSALDHAYKKGVIHRDIKPGNILIDAHNTVKLTDMGLAKGPADLTITREGATVGTPQYISPEQARDPQKVDVRSDLYSLGATLFHMCTGQPPFRAETIANVIFKVINERAPSAREVNPEISEELSLVIRKLMAKDPNLRYQTPEELLADLHRVQRDEQPDVNLRQLEALDQVGSSGRRWAMVVGGLVGLAAVVALVAVSVSNWRDNRGSQEPETRQAGPEDEYRKDLQKDLDTVGWRAKLAALTSREMVANAWQQEILRPVRAQLEQHLRSELDGFLARQDVPLRQWILNWGTAERFFKVELPDKLLEHLGLRPAELPRNLLGFHEQRVEQLKADVRAFEMERDKAYLSRLGHYHENFHAIVPEYRQRLQDDNFYGAERTLREALRTFRRDDPPLAQMPPKLRDEADRRQAALLNRELDHIAREEQRNAQKLCSSAEVVVGQVQQLLRTDAQRPINPREAQRLLADARKRLVAGFPPEHFRSESSPWPGVEDQLDAADREVQLASTNYERELKRLALRDALRIAVVDGRAGDAAAYLDGRVVKVGEQQLSQYITLWQQAEQAHQTMLKRLLDRNGSRLKVEKLLDRRETSVVLRKEHGRLVMKDRNRVLSLAAVNLRPLERLAGGEDFRTQLTADERVGLAAWYVLGGDYVEVSRLTPKGSRSEFLFQDLKPLWEHLRKEELGPQMAAIRLLENAHRALKEGDWQKALDTIHQMHQQHPAFYQSHQAEQERIKHEAEDGRERSRKLAVLTAEAPPGAKVSMRDWRVFVDYPLAQVDLSLQEGWGRSTDADGGLSYLRPTPTLADALESALVVKSLLAGDDSDEITVRITLSFPEQGGANPRLVLLRCCGVGVVLGLVRDGGVAAKGVRVSELTDARRLRKYLQPGLRAVWERGNVRRIETEARHQLKVVVQRRGRRLRGTVYLDGDPRPLIPTFDASGRLMPELAVLAMHPLTVHAVHFEGEVRRDG